MNDNALLMIKGYSSPCCLRDSLTPWMCSISKIFQFGAARIGATKDLAKEPGVDLQGFN